MFPRVLMAALAAAAFTVAAGAADKPAKPAAGASSNDVICTHEAQLGSHIKRRNCTTRAQREERAQRDQKALDDMGRRGPSGPGPGQ